MNEYINTEGFIRNLTIITVCYLGFVVLRSVYFAKANLEEAKRIGFKMIETVGYGNIEFYEDSGKESLTCRAMTDMETVDSQYAFEMNILFNNIFEMIFRIGVLLWSFYSMIIPVMVFMIDFYRKFFRYRRVTKALEMSSHEIS
jgi:ABC-type multidrug transport system fused ATPase/permease subunit